MPARRAWLRALERTAPIARRPGFTFPSLVQDLADRLDQAPALLGDERSLSYRALAEQANRYARWAKSEGLGPGDVVCLLSPNCPDYLAIWLGVTRVGAVVALVNSSLGGQSLAHAVAVARPRRIIVGAACGDAFAAALPQIAAEVPCWAHDGQVQDFPRIDEAALRCSGDRLGDAECPAPRLSDRALLIYTSGTTGLPKAAHVSHLRVMQWSHWFAGMMDTQPSDRMYNCLPMYHSIGGIVAVGATLVGGGAVVIRQRFSASRFWDDVAASECTLFQYIGELCRYLVDGPPHPLEAAHRLRLCCGNGLRPDIWERFTRRFAIPQVLEYYAATEGTFSLYNCEGEPGSIGRIPAFIGHRSAVALVRFDSEAGLPLRGEDGLCVLCAPDETGEALGRIDGDNRFEGYADAEATARKVLHDVLAPGDSWFRTGDLMRKDPRGHYYFVDRVGDTFRWKGENVATSEVTEVLLSVEGVADASVYGVLVPGQDGKAGMAALVVEAGFQLPVLHDNLAARLPAYARPLFLRLRAGIATTETFKQIKAPLLRNGFDPALIDEPLFVYDRVAAAYVVLDAPLHARIVSGDFKL